MNAAKLVELIKQLIAQAVGKSEKETQEFVKKQIAELPIIKGEKGDKGEDGINGKDGTSVTIDEVKEHIETSYSLSKLKEDIQKSLESLQEKLTSVKDGINGQDGKDGKDGESVTLEQVIKNLNETYSFDNMKESLQKFLETCQETIKNVKNGIDGQDGKDGKDGIDGKDAPEVNTKEIENNIIQNVSGIVDEEIKRVEVFANAIPTKLAELEEAFKKEVSSIQQTCGQWMDSVESRLKDLILPIVKNVIGEQKLLTNDDKEAFENRISELCKHFDETIDTLQKSLEGSNTQIKTLIDKNNELEQTVKSFSNGQDGKDGVDGKDAVVDYEKITGIITENIENISKTLHSDVQKAISEITNGKDGIDGKDAEVDYTKLVDLVSDHVGLKNIQETVQKALDSIVNGKDGSDGKDGINGQDGKDAVVDYEKLASWINEQVEIVIKDVQSKVDKAISEIVNGQDGKDGSDGKDGKDGVDGKDGSNGIHGKDALEVQILDVIDLTKQYARGTYATINGGLYKTFRSSDPVTDESQPLEKFGWTCIVKGIKGFTTQYDEESNEITLSVVDSEGKSVEQSVKFNPIIYKGVWREQDANEKPFAKNNSVTYNGGLWMSLVDNNKSRPGEDKSWQLAVKKGRDGKDGSKGEKGEKGESGSDGKDLTRVDEHGGRY